MTNGEVLQKTFPNSELETLSTKIVFTLEPRTLGQQVFVFDKAWWNEEYKEPVIRDNGVKDELEPIANDDEAVREFEGIEVTYTPEEVCIYPEYKGKPYFGIKYKENGEEIVGYGTYNPKVLSQYLKDYFIPTTKNDLPYCQHTDEEIAKSFIADVEAVKEQLPCGEQMDFPSTFDEFAKDYGFKDKDEVYTNGSELIPVFRVKQWLEHISTTKNNLAVDCIDRAELLKAMNTWDKFGNDPNIGLIRLITPALQDRYVPYVKYEDMVNCVKGMSSVTPLPSELEKNSKKLEKDFGESDCISRADAIQAMQDKAKKLTNEDTINGLCGAVAILFEMPSVTPQEPKAGHWKLVQRGKFIDVCCSNCGAVRIKEYAYNYTIYELNKEDINECFGSAEMRYCPHCGADMREVEE